MDPRERLNDPLETMLVAFEGFQAGIWTATPGIIQSFDATKQTCVVQPAIQAKVRNQDGITSNVNLPLLVDCPTQFLGGGGFTHTWPVAKGDECLVVFAMRCIDAWWYSGGIQPQVEFRMHDPSDGFVILGFRSRPRALSGISTTTSQFRSDDGASYVELAGGHVVNIVAPGGTNITGPLNVNGNTTFTGQVAANGHRIDESHKHTGVTTGGGITGVVTP